MLALTTVEHLKGFLGLWLILGLLVIFFMIAGDIPAPHKLSGLKRVVALLLAGPLGAFLILSFYTGILFSRWIKG
jgi:hypothetical protein